MAANDNSILTESRSSQIKQSNSAQITKSNIKTVANSSNGTFGRAAGANSLKYPLMTNPAAKQNGGLFPFVTFIPYQYLLPEAGVIESNIKKNKIGTPVQLYMPADISEKVGATWSNDQIFNADDSLVAAGAKLLQEAASKAGGLAAYAKAKTNSSPGPTDIFVFNKPNPYTLSFSYHFVPNNSAEAAAAEKVVRYFKTMVLPTIKAGSKTSLLTWPAVWDIKFNNCRVVGSPSAADGKYVNMALTDCTVTFSGGSNSVLIFNDKQPVRMAMSLSFQSVEYAVIVQ